MEGKEDGWMPRPSCQEYMHADVGGGHYVGWRLLFGDPVWIPGFGCHPSLPTWRAENCIQMYNGKWILSIGYYDLNNDWKGSCYYESAGTNPQCPDSGGGQYNPVGSVVGSVPTVPTLVLKGDKKPPP
jgi:hypothetical protein